MIAFSDTAFSIAMLAALILAYFGIRLVRQPDTRMKGVLMIVMALVLGGNVMILTM